MEEVKDSKSIIYNKFNRERESAEYSINKLYKMGGINEDKKAKYIKEQKSMYFSISALYYEQSSEKINLCFRIYILF